MFQTLVQRPRMFSLGWSFLLFCRQNLINLIAIESAATRMPFEKKKKAKGDAFPDTVFFEEQVTQLVSQLNIRSKHQSTNA